MKWVLTSPFEEVGSEKENISLIPCWLGFECTSLHFLDSIEFHVSATLSWLGNMWVPVRSDSLPGCSRRVESLGTSYIRPYELVVPRRYSTHQGAMLAPTVLPTRLRRIYVFTSYKVTRQNPDQVLEEPVLHSHAGCWPLKVSDRCWALESKSEIRCSYPWSWRSVCSESSQGTTISRSKMFGSDPASLVPKS